MNGAPALQILECRRWTALAAVDGGKGRGFESRRSRQLDHFLLFAEPVRLTRGRWGARGNSIPSPPAQRRVGLSRASFQLQQWVLTRGLLYRRAEGRTHVRHNHVSSAVWENSSCR
jgi:hypothetical protein